MSIIMMICFSRSGGTVLNQCLGSLPNVVIMSEVSPLIVVEGNKDASFRTVKEEARNYYQIDLKSDNFVQNVLELEGVCQRNGQQLVIRDWTFGGFLSSGKNPSPPPNKLLSLEALETKCDIIPFCFVRDPIDIWISLTKRLNFGVKTFFAQYLKYVKAVRERDIAIFKYEDFVKQPEDTIRQICQYTGLEFSRSYKNYRSNDNVTGDTLFDPHSRGRKSCVIKPLLRRRLPKKKIIEINQCEDMIKANKLLGYPTSYYDVELENVVSAIRERCNRFTFRYSIGLFRGLKRRFERYKTHCIEKYVSGKTTGKLEAVKIKKFISKANFDKNTILNEDLSWPKISIITPSYNQARFLEKTILSVLNQNYPNLEYIIIDGGSTDGSVDILKKYDDKLTYWISEKDSGMYDAINKGLKVASGSILAYLNSDDIYKSNTIQTVIEYFQKHPDSFLLYGDTDYIDAEGNYVYTYRYPAFKYKRYIQLNWSSIPQQACFWRRDVHEKIGNFNSEFKLAGDFEFFARAGKHCRIDHLKQVFSAQRIHTETLSCTRADINKQEVKKIHERHSISDGFISSCRRTMIDVRIKLLNFPLMLKKLFQLLTFRRKLLK